MRPGFGPAAELPAFSLASRRHGSCRSRLGSSNVMRGKCRAAPASARGTGRTAYTKDVGRTEPQTPFQTALSDIPVPDAEPHECVTCARVIFTISHGQAGPFDESNSIALRCVRRSDGAKLTGVRQMWFVPEWLEETPAVHRRSSWCDYFGRSGSSVAYP